MAGLWIPGMAHADEETKQPPPAIAKLGEKKFSHEQYQAVLLGKVVFSKGGQPLDSKDAIQLTFVRKDSSNATVSVDIRDNEGFILEAAPGNYQIQEVVRNGRSYRIGPQFGTRNDEVIYLGVLGIELLGEDVQAYEYQLHLDTTFSQEVLNRHPEFTRLLVGYSPPSFKADRGNVTVFALEYHELATAKYKEEKSLAKAAQNGDLATVQELLQAGAKVDTPDAENWTPLLRALRNGHPVIASALIQRGASITPTTSDGWTPLMLALRYEAESARPLLDKGAAVNVRSNAGTTALMLAIANCSDEIVQALLDKGADVMAIDGHQWTTLMWALRYEKKEVAKRLIEKKVDLRAKDNGGWTALMYALRYNGPEAARLLMEKGAAVDDRNNQGWSPLHHALRYCPGELSGLLVEKAASVDGATSAGTTPLMLALQFAPPAQARRLIERGANVNSKDKDGWTPLMFALRYNQAENARLLIDKGASLEDRNQDGWTPLSFALRYGQTDLATLLIEKGVEFNYKTLGNWEPLLTALRNGQAENAHRLILKGANVNAKTDNNWTALMFAIGYDQPENAKLLLSKGADATVQTKDGKTALSLAQEKNYFDLIRLLTPAGAATASAAGPARPAAAEAAPARVETASARVPRILGDALAWPAWATVVSAEDCGAGLTGVMQCKATVEATAGKAEAYNYFEKTMKKAGWRFDKGSHAQSESGSLAGQSYWGYLGFVRHPSDGGFVGTTFEFQSDSSLTGDKTRLTITYQSFPKKLKSVTYPQVVATYPPGAATCKTTIDVIGVGSDGSWRTSGMVDYRNFVPQLQCLGTRVTLKIPLALGSINYSVGTKLTVDKDRNWVSVQSWE